MRNSLDDVGGSDTRRTILVIWNHEKIRDDTRPSDNSFDFFFVIMLSCL